MTENFDGPNELPQPLPFHDAIRDYLRTHEPAVWDWYAKNRTSAKHAENVRFELLKTTYRIEPESDPQLYALATAAAASLDLDVPLTLYQAQDPAGPNASLVYLPGQAHIVLHGPLSRRLDELELQTVLGHELSHLLLWQMCDGEYLIVDQILAALTLDARATAVHLATARLFRLYTEIFCDRGAWCVIRDTVPVITALVKVNTDVEQVDPDSYLRQLDEIFDGRETASNQPTHPEVFIRARALQLWAAEEDRSSRSMAEEIERMINGQPALDELDFLTQVRVGDNTRWLIDQFLDHPALQTSTMLAHARLFFSDYEPPGSARPVEPQPPVAMDQGHSSILDYYCYVLLDFATAQRELEEVPMAAALVVAERIGLIDRFLETVRKELKLRKKQLEKLQQQKEQILLSART